MLPPSTLSSALTTDSASMLVQSLSLKESSVMPADPGSR